MYQRFLTESLMAALADTPVVVLHGARQSGKSTLVQQLAWKERAGVYRTMDQAGVLAAARNDPEGFISEADAPLILDEIQRAPELVLAIKASVDRDRRPGRFLLTGSAHVLQLPQLADSLVGRMEILTLRPLSQGEIQGVREGFVDAVFAATLPKASATIGKPAVNKRDLAQRVLAGGYPEAIARKERARRRRWFESYLSTLILRDVKELSNIAGLTDFPRLLTAVAGRAGGLLNYAELGRDVGLNQMTVKRYLTLLRATFIIQTVPPWFTNRVKRVVKSEKVYLGDPGLLAYLLDVTPERFAADPKIAGALMENFVAVELLKQASWSQTRPTLWHFRDHQGHEVDFVMEAQGGNKLVGVEVKSRATLNSGDFQGLRLLAEAAGDRFHRGVVLYAGSEAIPFGRNLFALPLDALWRMAS